ncbi:uncharacterized protein AMSG_04945 [Thecamonas trahens ATCC 50062]|uniref:Glycosyltransferase 61 catalytic domain-containing protein n=1 Tax=Thecamonas trahens ATCC 50062 TaxID=461836 RepID=A0A0L0DB24_THETB|nr:hypothetical protein AMSG_04945 [Thecamonas trahens ATCC 50062]KNC48498.1 hypothetical protein AMSG_04945 [Thecamonas trahens ATCC 50062]|eukprot:XP_013758608.1 hypothetical protein AMSG_04945 [Thecamonas trahens ATCC 50062]
MVGELGTHDVGELLNFTGFAGVSITRSVIETAGEPVSCCAVVVPEDLPYLIHESTAACLAFNVGASISNSLDYRGATVTINAQPPLSATNEGDPAPQRLGKVGIAEWHEGLLVDVGFSGSSCTIPDNRTLFVAHEPWTNTFWHDFHNGFMRTFGTLYELDDPSLLQCDDSWPEACRVNTTKVIIAYWVTSIGDHSAGPTLLGLLPHLADEIITEPDPSHCFARVVAGQATALDLNAGIRFTVKSTKVLSYFSRWYYYVATGEPLEPALGVEGAKTPGSRSGLTELDLERLAEPRTEHHVLIISRQHAANGRRWGPGVKEAMMTWLESSGVSVEAVDFAAVSVKDIAAAVRRATVIIGVSGAGMINMMFARPDTVLIYIYPERVFAHNDPLNSSGIYITLARMRGCQVVVVHEYTAGSDTDNYLPLPIAASFFKIGFTLGLGGRFPPPTLAPVPSVWDGPSADEYKYTIM